MHFPEVNALTMHIVLGALTPPRPQYDLEISLNSLQYLHIATAATSFVNLIRTNHHMRRQWQARTRLRRAIG